MEASFRGLCPRDDAEQRVGRQTGPWYCASCAAVWKRADTARLSAASRARVAVPGTEASGSIRPSLHLLVMAQRRDSSGVSEPEFPTGQGQDVSFFLELITDSAQLAKRLEVSASASLKLGIGGGSAKAKFVSEQKINSYSAFLLVHVVVKNPTKRIRDVRITDSARELLATGKRAYFAGVVEMSS
jgi:hypothetical protein